MNYFKSFRNFSSTVSLKCHFHNSKMPNIVTSYLASLGIIIRRSCNTANLRFRLQLKHYIFPHCKFFKYYRRNPIHTVFLLVIYSLNMLLCLTDYCGWTFYYNRQFVFWASCRTAGLCKAKTTTVACIGNYTTYISLHLSF